MTAALMPAGPDAWHMLDTCSLSVVIVIVIAHKPIRGNCQDAQDFDVTLFFVVLAQVCHSGT